MKSLFSMSPDPGSSFFLLKSFHQKGARAKYLPYLSLTSVPLILVLPQVYVAIKILHHWRIFNVSGQEVLIIIGLFGSEILFRFRVLDL
jgi:hypothetical protein